MKCCTPHTQGANRLFSFFARNYRKRFARQGFEASQKQLLDGIKKADFSESSILEIGSGVGYLHQTLLEQGAASATGIDLAQEMIVQARLAAQERSLSERTTYQQGDFIELSASITPADIVILDKVVCCYPDADLLVHASVAKAKRIYALTLPRNRWYVRFGIAMGVAAMWLIRSGFRPYFHSPPLVAQWIEQQGFRKSYENQTLVWLTQVYVR